MPLEYKGGGLETGMIKMLTAHTMELDDSELAVSELLAQLGPLNLLYANNIGLISCHADFIEEGIVEAIGSALPFPTVGSTTLSSGVPGTADVSILTLSIISSDDTEFIPLRYRPTDDSFTPDAGMTGGMGKLLLTYFPSFQKAGGEPVMERLSEVFGNTPILGMLACDESRGADFGLTISDGKAYSDECVMVLFKGAFDPELLLVNVHESDYQRKKAIITESEDHIVKSINGLVASEYIKTLGIDREQGAVGLTAIPAMITISGSSRSVSRGIYTFTPEGYMICGAKMPENSTFALGRMDAGHVLEDDETMAGLALDSKNKSGVIIFSCLTRNLALGVDNLDSFKKIDALLGGKLPYQMCYAGGEMCPLHNDAGTLENLYHNFTMVACVF